MKRFLLLYISYSIVCMNFESIVHISWHPLSSDKPSKPLGPLKFSDITHESVVLTWQPSESDGGTPLTGYLIEYRDARRPTWMKTATVGPDVHKHTVKDLIEGSEYFFRVTAINAEGHSQPLESKDAVKPQRELSKYKTWICHVLSCFHFSIEIVLINTKLGRDCQL